MPVNVNYRHFAFVACQQRALELKIQTVWMIFKAYSMFNALKCMKTEIELKLVNPTF